MDKGSTENNVKSSMVVGIGDRRICPAGSRCLMLLTSIGARKMSSECQQYGMFCKLG